MSFKSLLIDEWVLPDVGAPLPGASQDYSYVDASIRHGKKRKPMDSFSWLCWARDQEDLANRWHIRDNNAGQ